MLLHLTDVCEHETVLVSAHFIDSVPVHQLILLTNKNFLAKWTSSYFLQSTIFTHLTELGFVVTQNYKFLIKRIH